MISLRKKDRSLIFSKRLETASTTSTKPHLRGADRALIFFKPYEGRALCFSSKRFAHQLLTRMRTPYTQLYLHCVWSTWDRQPLITPVVERAVFSAIRAKCHDLKCEVIALNGMPDHVHLLVRFPATLCIADLLKEVKGSSSHLVTHQITPGEFFKWQGAYGSFTVSKKILPIVKAYIEQQKIHHAQNELGEDWEQTYADETEEGVSE